MKLLLFFILISSAFNLQADETEWELSLLGGYGIYSPWSSANNNDSYDIQNKNSKSAQLLYQPNKSTSFGIYYSDGQVELDLTESASLDFNISKVELVSTKYTDSKSMTEYFGAGVGITQFSPLSFSGSRKDDLSFSFFAGAQLELTDNIAFILDGRAHFVVLDSVTNIACSGGCIVQIKSEVWSHLQLNAGISIRF